LSGRVDPARPISNAREDVKDLLERDVPFFNGAAAFVLAVHACADFPAVEPLHRELFAELTPHGRLWQLLGFAVLLPDTPPAWKELLEDFTRRILDEHRDPLQDETAADLLCVPLGLAYGKRGEPMRLYDEWLRDGLARGDAAQVRQVLVGLGPVGFYFPDVVFATLRPLVADLVRGPHQQELSTTLAIIRTLHFDAVDGFLAQSGVEEAFRRRVSVAADVALVHGHIQLLGFYNNAVHLSLHYPRMRRVLSAGALALMAEAETSRDFVRQYTKDVFQLARETGFHILEWTRPEKDSLPSR
jgi:hypothetical protein